MIIPTPNPLPTGVERGLNHLFKVVVPVPIIMREGDRDEFDIKYATVLDITQKPRA
jgi:hypothetical protein